MGDVVDVSLLNVQAPLYLPAYEPKELLAAYSRVDPIYSQPQGTD